MFNKKSKTNRTATRFFVALSALLVATTSLAAAPEAQAQNNAGRINVGQNNVRELRNGEFRLRIDNNCRLTLSRNDVVLQRSTQTRNNCTNPRIDLRRSNNGNGNRVLFGVRTGSNNVGQTTVSDGTPRIANIRLTNSGELRGFDNNNRLVARNLQNDILGETIIATSQIRFPNRQLTSQERQNWLDEYVATGGPTQFERDIVQEVNRLRRQNGIPQLTIDEHLSAAARFYAQTMANLQTRLGHSEGPDGGSFWVADRLGVPSSQGRSNASFGNSVRQIIDGWLRSPGHEANMFAELVYHIGVGTYIADNGSQYTYLIIRYLPNGPIIANDPQAQFAAINRARAAAGLNPLQWNECLATQAREGSETHWCDGFNTTGWEPAAGNLSAYDWALDPEMEFVGISCTDPISRACRAAFGQTWSRP